MKKQILLIIILLPIVCWSQEIGTVFQNNMNAIYQNVDRTPVTTGLLKDYGLMMTDVAVFNGSLYTNNYTNRSVWSTLYTSLYNMRFNAKATLPNINTVNTAIDSYITADGATVSLMALHYNYQQFKTNAVSGNLVYVVNNKIYDTPKRTASPYEIKDAFAFALGKDYLVGGRQTFILRSDLFYRNVTKAISSIQIDLADGLGFRVITLGTPFTADYTTDGGKDIIFKVTYADGQVLQSQSRINLIGVTRQNCSNCRYSAQIPERFPKGNFPVPTSQMGFSSAIIATAGTDRILDKPLILVEGFDPENRFDVDTYLGINALGVGIDKDFQGQTLGQALEANNYDLVFLNYGNGGDDIKRNAYLLENMIKWVNEQTAANGSKHKNVVIGVSMGGVVARYALRDMELRNVNHNTRLYASVDSPHQGANVPLGFQAAVKHLGGLNIFGFPIAGSNPQLKRGVASLNSPAATQMLTYQLTGQGSSLAITNAPSTTFYNEYKTMGMPRLWGIRNIAVASGSECGQNQGFVPYSQMLTGNGTLSFSYLNTLLVNTVLSPLQTFTGFDPFAMFTGLLTTYSEIKTDLSIRSLPDQQALPIFTMRIYYRKEILFGLIVSESNLSNYSLNSTANLLPLDSYPGGKFDINNFATIPSSVSIVKLNPIITRFNFIPTTSSLDVGSGTQPITTSDYLRAYSPASPPAAPKNVPFHNFYSNPLSNENHPSITTKNGNWLFAELQGSPIVASCNYLCQNTSISSQVAASSALCTSATFTIQNPTPNATYNWSTSNSAGVSINASTGAATRINNFVGLVTIKAMVGGICGSSPITKDVWVGSPPADNSYIVWTGLRGINPVTLSSGSTNPYSADPVPYTNYYTWTLPPGFSAIGPTTTSSPYISITTGSQTGTFRIYCQANNACGGSYLNSLRVTVTNSGGGGGMQMRAAYPNPANTITTIKLKESASTDVAEVTLIDQSIQIVFHVQTAEKEIDIPTQNLKNGTYFLTISLNGEITRKQLIIKH